MARPLLVRLAPVLLIRSAGAQRLPTLDPQTETSPSGHYSLFENPNFPDGGGEAYYRLMKDGLTVWSANLPYSLRQFGVTDDGVVAGYAYTNGADQVGKFTISILNPNGKSRLYEPHTWTMTSAGPVPKIDHFFVDGPNDRMILGVADSNRVRNQTYLWEYQLSGGKPLARHQIPRPDPNTRFLIDARPVAGTPLILLDWRRDDGRKGMVFNLVDLKGNEYWRTTLPANYATDGPPGAKRATDTEMGRTGSIDAVGVGKFAIQEVKAELVVAYAVTKAGDKWLVAEESRKPYIAESGPLVRPANLILAPMGRFELPVKTAEETAIHDIDDFLLIPGERIAVLRGGAAPALLETDAMGKVLRAAPLPLRPTGRLEQRIMARLGEGRYVVFVSSSSVGAGSRALMVDLAKGRAEVLRGFKSSPIKAAVGDVTGGFVVIADEAKPTGGLQSLSAYDAAGRSRWSHVSGTYSGKPSDILSPTDLTIDASGHVVVLDNIRHLIQLFDPQGLFISALELDKLWPTKPVYPSNLAATSDGGFVLYDYGASKSIRRLHSNGTPWASLVAQYRDGKSLLLARTPKLDSRGRVWVTDRDSIYRLDSRGRTLSALGAAPVVMEAKKLADVKLDAAGNVYTLDALTGELLSFDHGGKVRFVATPLPTDYRQRPILGAIAVAPSGDVYVSIGNFGLTHAHYSPKGVRITPKKDAPSAPPRAWHWEGLSLLDDRDIEQTRIKRWPNLDWLRDAATYVAPSGGLAVFSTGDHPNRLAFYSPNGDPLQTAQVPLQVTGLSNFAYDGLWVYFARKNDILAVNHAGRPVWRFPLPTGLRGANQVLAWSGGIGIYDGKRTIYWYHLP